MSLEEYRWKSQHFTSCLPGTTVTKGVWLELWGISGRTLASLGHCQELTVRMLQVLASRKLRPLVSQGLMPDVSLPTVRC